MSSVVSSSSSFGGLKDFSVDAQRRMFIEAQERERQAAENKKASRKIRQATAGASGVALSGMMANLEGGGTGIPAPKRVTVGDDDDDSLPDDWSLDSEESFYVGIERADYAQPDNLEMYGEGKEDDVHEPKEDRLGISRVSIAIINRGGKEGRLSSMEWDADLAIQRDGRCSSLHEFMNGSTDAANGRAASRKDVDVVAMPIVGTSLEWQEEGKLGEDDDDAIDQVYEHRAAEGKAFIDKLVEGAGGGASSSSSAGVAADMATPGAAAGSGGGGKGNNNVGNYPVISPMALFSPGLTVPGAGSVVDGGGDNGVRQMREREIRREAASGANDKLARLKSLIAKNKDGLGKVDAYDLMKQLEKLMAE